MDRRLPIAGMVVVLFQREIRMKPDIAVRIFNEKLNTGL
jgi:hypothetical protein